MLTVGCDDGVLCLEGLHHTDRDGLFADIEMEETANYREFPEPSRVLRIALRNCGSASSLAATRVRVRCSSLLAARVQTSRQAPFETR